MKALRKPRTDRHPTITVAICAKDEEETIADCISSVLEQSRPPDEILVVNDHSADRTVEVAKAFPIRLVDNMRYGLGGARRRAVSEASSELIAFIDADCVADKRWLEEAETCLLSTKATACTGLILPRRTKSTRELAKALLETAEFRAYEERAQSLRYPWLNGGNSVFWRDSVLEAGDYDDGIIGTVCEDTDMQHKLEHHGGKFEYCPSAIVRHRYDGRIKPSTYRLHYSFASNKAFFLRWHTFDPNWDVYLIRRPTVFMRILWHALSIAMEERKPSAFFFALATWLRNMLLGLALISAVILTSLPQLATSRTRRELTRRNAG